MCQFPARHIHRRDDPPDAGVIRRRTAGAERGSGVQNRSVGIQILPIIRAFQQAAAAGSNRNRPDASGRQRRLAHGLHRHRRTRGTRRHGQILRHIRLGAQHIPAVHRLKLPADRIPQRRDQPRLRGRRPGRIPQIAAALLAVEVIRPVCDPLRLADVIIHRQRGLIRRAVIRREGLFDVCAAVLHRCGRLKQQTLRLYIVAGLPALDRVGDVESIAMGAGLRRAIAVRNRLRGQQRCIAVRVHVRPVRRGFRPAIAGEHIAVHHHRLVLAHEVTQLDRGGGDLIGGSTEVIPNAGQPNSSSVSSDVPSSLYVSP